MRYQKLLKIILCCHLLFAICHLLTGCATSPRREALPTYNIDGTAYVPLISLCISENVDCEYDTFTRRVVLTGGEHRVNLIVGDKLVLVDGREQRLKRPVDTYRGTVVVPYRFKEDIFDRLFRKAYPAGRAVSREWPIRKVVLDPGHGGSDPGAIGRSGLKEKYINLDIAKRLSSLLRADGLGVVMTRNADTTVSLKRRMEIANSSRADLFISIHSNANRVRSMNGFEVYCLSSAVSDSKRAVDSAQSDALYLEKGSFASGPSLNLKAILWDMIYTSNRADSLRLASSICRSADRDLSSRVKGTRSGPYYVLKGAHMPTILIEVGYLSNRDEERLLKNSYYRQQLAEAIEKGITNYIRECSLTEFAQR